MEPYEVLVNQPVVIDNVSMRGYASWMLEEVNNGRKASEDGGGGRKVGAAVKWSVG